MSLRIFKGFSLNQELLFETGISYGNEKPNDDVVDIHQ